MPGRKFIRQFTDNNKYAEFDKIPYMDALAYVVQEYVYSDKLDGSLLHFHMKEEIPMFDFMTLAAYFVSESQQDFGKSTIRGFVEDLKKHSWGKNNTHVEYPDNYLFVTCASYELIMGLLWTTYIYQSACYMFSKNEKFAEISSMVYGVMVEESGLKKEAFLKGSLSENASSARKTMLSYMVRNEVRNGLKKEEAPKESSAANDSKKDARIAELEAELAKAQADIEAYEQQGKGVSAAKHALLLTTLCQHLGGLPQNGRQSLSYILQKLYGYTESTAEKALKQKVTQRDANALAKLFHGISPRVENLIAGMPKLLEELNNERLRKLNGQKNQKK